MLIALKSKLLSRNWREFATLIFKVNMIPIHFTLKEQWGKLNYVIVQTKKIRLAYLSELSLAFHSHGKPELAKYTIENEPMQALTLIIK